MANEYSIYDPRTMGKIIQRTPPVRTFLKSTFFGHERTFVTKSVDVDYKKGGRALAPFVHPKIGGKTIANGGYQTKSYTPPLIAPNKITTAGDLESRMAGENIYSGMTPADRAVKKLAEDFTELSEMITRREEWMIAQAIFSGKIPIIGEGLKEEIDFGFTNKETLASAKKWSASGSDPIADLKRWRKQVQKTGFVNCNICIMADDVATSFINNEKVKSILDVKGYDLATIKPRELPNGATYVGTIPSMGLDIYTYNEWYLDDWTNPTTPEQKPLVPDGTLALLSTNASYSMYYGAVTLLDGKGGAAETFITVEGARVPDTWTNRNPARRFLQLNSHPLPILHEVDSWYVAVVL
jgi:Phage major capsid protein E.